MNILQINSSARRDASHSTRLATRVVERLRETAPESTLTVRDLNNVPHPILDEAALGALFTPANQRTPEQAARVALDDALIAELQAADVVVLGVPMYNFGVPSTLKAYFDYVGRAGETFRYTANGPEGLLTGKQAYVFAARGGLYAGAPSETETSYVRQFLSFLGITDIEFVYAGGLAMGDASRTAALEAAAEAIVQLTDTSRLVA